MKLSYREAQRVVVGLRRIDEHDDTKLSAETRLKIGINLNRLIPSVRVFEKEIGRIQNQLVNGAANNPGRVKELSDELETISETLETFKLKKLVLAELELSKNAKIKSETLSMIAPVVRDFDDGKGDED